MAGRLNRFFWWCAGVHADTLQKYPEENNKYVSIGATIFFTGLFATLAGGYALYFVFSGSTGAVIYAILFGIIWGLAIFNLDRYIVLSINKSKGHFSQFLQALPRILLAILIGIVISRPLELKIFDKEIRENLRVTYMQQQKAKIDTLNKTFEMKYNGQFSQLNQMLKEADSLESSVKTAKKQLNHEIFGTKTDETSGVLGYGPFAKLKEEGLKNNEIYLDTLRKRIDERQKALLSLKKSEGLLDQHILSNKNLDSAVAVAGFADRNSALGNLHKKSDGTIDSTIQAAVYFIALLFVFFECLPVFVKLMSGLGPYDVAIQNQNDVHIYESNSDNLLEKEVLDELAPERKQEIKRRRTGEINMEDEFRNI